MINLEFEGGAELAANLRTLSTRLSRRIVTEALREAAEPMRKQMSRMAPHEPGKPDLRDAMSISRAMGADSQEVAVAVGPTRSGFYGSFQELGTKHHAAQPFLRPSFDSNVQPSLRILAAAVWRELAAKGIGRSVTSTARATGGRFL